MTLAKTPINGEKVCELAISCNQIGDYPNCHQNVFIQYLMEADTEIHNQALDETPGVLLKKGRRNCRSYVVKVMMGKPTETADLSSWELMDSGPTFRKPAWNWLMPSAPVSRLCSLTWSMCKAPSSMIRTCPWFSVGFWEPVSHTGLPALMQGAEFCTAST